MQPLPAGQPEEAVQQAARQVYEEDVLQRDVRAARPQEEGGRQADLQEGWRQEEEGEVKVGETLR